MTRSAGLSLHNISDDPAVETERKEVTVLVTGYGPFLDLEENASWSIASTLPTHLPATASLPIPICIIVPPKPLRVAYAHVAKVAPKLLSGTYSCSDDFEETVLPVPDVVLHIGVAAKRSYYTLERQSRAGHFNELKDVDGRVFPNSEAKTLFAGCPTVLKPTFDTADVWRRWRTYVADPAADIRPSDDPGYYLCGFIYYVSMAWYWKRNRESESTDRPVAFLHVPDLDEADVPKGREIAVGLIRALVASREKVGMVDPLGPESKGVSFGDGSAANLEDLRKRWNGIDDFAEVR